MGDLEGPGTSVPGPFSRRWPIAALLGAGVLVTYLDRVNLSVCTQPLMERYGLDEAAMGWVLSASMGAYKLVQIPVGLLLDRFGVRAILRWSILLWALTTFATAWAPGLAALALARIGLGVAEAPIFPACAKAVGAWFPPQERSLATALFDAAAKLAMVIGIPLVAWAVSRWGWQAAFVACGALTLAYAGWFWSAYSEAPSAAPRTAGGRTLPPGRALAGLLVGFGGYGYGLFMLITWLPGYLQRELHMSVLKSGMYAAVPWSVATLTDVLLGGWLVDRLVRAGYPGARKAMITLGMTAGMAIVGAALDPSRALLWITISLGGLAMVSPIAWSLPALIAAPDSVGLTASLASTATNLMGVTAGVLTGYLAQHYHSFTPAFLVMGAVLAVGVAGFLAMPANR